MSTARDTVNSTPELLELTLAQLPMRDLLLAAPLVSKTWLTITLSPTVQRALFFQPDPQSEPVQNPLLVELFPPFFAPEGQNRWAWPGQASAIMSMPWSKAPDAFRRADASWRRMLVTQPPTQTIVIREINHARMGDFERQAVLRDLSLRMGALYDLSVPFIDRVASSFCIRWHPGLELEGDLTLVVMATQQCNPRSGRILDERFHSQPGIEESLEIKFGQSVQRPRGQEP
ncbi:hypothetical protein DFH07DRAFT_831247 [Mycena maculata]|uniref:F-box domain-containing protein n=1 Tax=Mycena maculata TaxID=230809 RepID=A0AAD7IQK0_9AGAR|nr:hypothetical protein DFH07DRAFT_831247 [Mycena maculata]